MKVEDTNPNHPASFTIDNSGLKSKLPSKPLTEEDFLRLFVAQMKTQNPTKPVDSSDMMQQMAQMSSLRSANSLEKAIKDSTGQTQILAAGQLIGKNVVIPSKISPLVQGKGLDGSLALMNNASSITVEIKDSSDKLVKTINMPETSAGLVDFHWDGNDADGKPMADGQYKISARAVFGGVAQDIETAGNFKVNSVMMNRKDASIILNIDGFGGVGMSDIIKYS